MKKLSLMFVILFVCGILSADICIEQLNTTSVILDMDTYLDYANANPTFREGFWSVLYARVKMLVLLILLLFTPLKDKISIILSGLFSYIWGFFFMCAIAELGLAGVVVAISSVVPHGFFYTFVIYQLCKKKRAYSFHGKDKMVIQVLSYTITFLCFLTGCVLETLVATHFLPWVIRLSAI